MKWRKMKRIVLIFSWSIAVVAVAAGTIIAQTPTPPPSKYQPTEVQNLRLKVKQQDLIIASKNAQELQKALQDAQKDAQTKYADLMKEADTVKTEQKWPANLIFNPDQLSFTEPPPAPAAPPKKEEPAKKP